MKSILEKISTTEFPETCESIISSYNNQWFCVVNFIYFSQIVSQHLFSHNKERTEKERDYKKILLKSDFLLPDWIALQTFYYFANLFKTISSEKKRLPNINWTDFTPYFLNNIKQKYGNQKINILLYWSTQNTVNKVQEVLSLKWYNVIYAQDWFTPELNREEVQKTLSEYQDTINILLVARSTPKIPLQELRTLRNYREIQKNKLLVMNVWWLFDFIAWVQKRAPKIVRTLKLEWLRRLFADWKRNWKKVANSLMIIPYIFHYLILKKE